MTATSKNAKTGKLATFADPAEGELCVIDIDALEFASLLSEEVEPMRGGNQSRPIIVRETTTGYYIQDGFGRASGCMNAGKDVHAIIVSAADVAARGNAAGDDAAWVLAMHEKYAPHSAMAIN